MKMLTTLPMSSVDSDDPAIKLIPCQVTFASDCFTDTAPDSTGLIMTKLVQKIVSLVSSRLRIPSPSFLSFLSVCCHFPCFACLSIPFHFRRLTSSSPVSYPFLFLTRHGRLKVQVCLRFCSLPLFLAFSPFLCRHLFHKLVFYAGLVIGA